MLCRVLMERLPPHVVIIYLANPSLSRDDIVFAIADELELGIPENSRPSAVVRALQGRLIELYAGGKQVVVLIDEAHAMPKETLEEIRLLSNLESRQHKLLQLVMFGQPELDAVLARPDMRQLKERITQNFHLEPLRRDDIAEYLDFRMRTAGYKGPPVFAADAVKLIAKASQGLTRRVNILADKALLAAYAANGHQITPDQVAAAIRDSDYGDPGRDHRRFALGAAAAAAVLLALAAAIVQRDNGAAAPATANAAIAPPAADAPREPAPPVSDPVPPAGTPPKPAANSATEQRLQETRQWIEATPGHRWFVQLVQIDGRETDYARSFFTRASRLLPDETIRIYRAAVGDEQRIGIIYGDFPSAQAATEAIQLLPADLQNHKPYARPVRALK